MPNRELAETLDALAELIAANYFDPTAGDEIARELRGSANGLDGADPEALAQQLTERLRAHDRHFKVQWGPWKPASRPRKSSPANASGIRFRRLGSIGILEVHSFENADDPAVLEQTRRILHECADSLALVIDLRDVPGGWPSMVEVLLGAFTGPDPVHILTFHSRGEPMETWSKVPLVDERLLTMPVFVVVNAQTASAAESLAYALQSLGRATVIGQTTAGAANPGEAFESETGFSVFISTASPLDPRTGGNWETIGVCPDVQTTSDPLAKVRELLHDTSGNWPEIMPEGGQPQ